MASLNAHLQAGVNWLELKVRHWRGIYD